MGNKTHSCKLANTEGKGSASCWNTHVGVCNACKFFFNAWKIILNWVNFTKIFDSSRLPILAPSPTNFWNTRYNCKILLLPGQVCLISPYYCLSFQTKKTDSHFPQLYLVTKESYIHIYVCAFHSTIAIWSIIIQMHELCIMTEPGYSLCVLNRRRYLKKFTFYLFDKKILCFI